MKRVVSEREEREIEALFEQNRTSMNETDLDRFERLSHELREAERRYVERVSRMNKRPPMNLWDKCFVIGIMILSFCSAWALAAVFVWKGWALPWFLR